MTNTYLPAKRGLCAVEKEAMVGSFPVWICGWLRDAAVWAIKVPVKDYLLNSSSEIRLELKEFSIPELITSNLNL